MIGNQYTIDWTRYQAASLNEPIDTCVPASEVERLSGIVSGFPEGFKLNARVRRIVDDRRKMAAGDVPMDWGFAESLAYASLLAENYHIRLVGQDSVRGTFFHRHAEFHHAETGETYVPLEHVVDAPRAFLAANSLLSEEAVLGFEYGYSTTSPDCLVIWEAQFGDFVNGAQVVIDQFISSGEAKWGRHSGLTLFLPHGYEGQGPEHSSARLERFLQLCAEHNMQVVVPSTPAQMFHLLRRQMIRPLRKPLVVLTPKSLLRHRLSVSQLEELSAGGFRPLIDEQDELAREDVRRLVFCSGKVYYDLLEPRAGDRAHCYHPHRRALSVSDRRIRACRASVPERARDRLVPGGAAESGRLVSDPASAPGAADGAARALLRGTARRCCAGFRHSRAARAPAAGVRLGGSGRARRRARERRRGRIRKPDGHGIARQ